MSAILSNKNDVNNILNFIEDVNSSNGAYYFFVGRTLPWPDDNNPPTADASYHETEHSIYHDIAFGKLISNSNMAQLIHNWQWTANTVYTQYSMMDGNLLDSTEKFYVVNDVYAVYKCIDNNNGANSTIKPSITPVSGTFQTSDGYTWKYMYTVPTGANNLFTTSNWVPVVANTQVANNAVPGTIDVIRVTVPGSNWQTYNTGFLVNVITPTTVQLAVNASSIDGFYTNSSIYLKAGLGAAQLRQITSYNGSTQVASVSPAFDTLVNLFLGADLSGQWLIGDLVQQNYTLMAFLFQKGFFNKGDTVVQSDTNATGTVYTANATVMSINQASGNNFGVGSNAYPIRDTVAGDVLQTGGVTITLGSNVVTGNSTANLLTLSTGGYLRVGTNANLNVRRIATITNSSQLTTSLVFNNSATANVFYNVPYAAEPTSSQLVHSNGTIIQTNLNSIILTFTNTSSNSIGFIAGETVKEYDSTGIDQSTNAVVSFANSTSLVLSDIHGTFLNNLFIVGQSSSLKAQVLNITTYPSVTLNNGLGTFVSGDVASSYFANGTVSGSATVMGASYTPSPSTEYIVSPTVKITGDGVNAAAYSVVNTSSNGIFPVQKIVMINNGTGYTQANATLIANNLWGNGNILYCEISPVQGHGSNTAEELAADNLGITVTFDTASNELYKFPTYGSYRRVGIIKNPLFNDLYLSLGPTLRQNINYTLIGANSFVNNEIVTQNNGAVAAKIVVANSTVLQLKDLNGTILPNAHIFGTTSIATGNVTLVTNANFIKTTNSQVIYQTNNTSANGILTQVVNNSVIRVTNASGKFVINSIVYDPTTNAYANVISLNTANNTVNSSISFGTKFNQTSRLTLSTNNNIAFQVGEYINQTVSHASGLVVDTTHEKDIIYSSISGTFSTGITVTDANTGANGTIIFANTTYLRVTGVQGTFNTGDLINTLTANGTVTSALNVLVVIDQPDATFQTGANLVTGNTSGATGLLGISNTIVYPDLVRNSGDVLYVNDIKPFQLGLNTREVFNIIITA